MIKNKFTSPEILDLWKCSNQRSWNEEMVSREGIIESMSSQYVVDFPSVWKGSAASRVQNSATHATFDYL